ncbi:MAG: flagellar biosynthesis protein FlhB [Aquabacterium sp.]
MADAQDRNLPASARKLKKARADGNVPRSRDLAHLLVVGVGVALVAVLWDLMAGWMRALLAAGLHFDAATLATPGVLGQRLSDGGARMLALVVPFGLALGGAAVVAAVASGGWNFAGKAVGFQLSRVGPLSGIGRLFSKAHLAEVGKAILLAVVLSVVGWLYLRHALPRFHDTLTMPLPTGLAETGRAIGAGVVLVLLALAAFALVDVPLQRFMWRSRLKMSVAELKQEHKDVEGNVEVKAKVKARMREIVKRRMLAAVPGADLVVMNPTHYAVALKYDESSMAAPRVVAKGADLLALRIRDIARDAKVPVLRLPPLARALYTHAELDQEVPPALFAAVAMVLAHVYRLRDALAGRGAMPMDLAEVPVPPELDPHHPAAAAAGAAA